MSDKKSFLNKSVPEVLTSVKTVCAECIAHSLEWKTDSKFRKLPDETLLNFYV
jgi:hypothetical protein